MTTTEQSHYPPPCSSFITLTRYQLFNSLSLYLNISEICSYFVYSSMGILLNIQCILEHKSNRRVVE